MLELSLHILDVMENSLEAAATLIEVIIDEDLAADRLTITVHDNGRGMSDEQLARVYDPFFTTRSTRRVWDERCFDYSRTVGLGIPLFKTAAERCNGRLTITSQLGKGTMLQAIFQHSHIDRAPLGDITGTLLTVILSGRCDVYYVHRVDGPETEKRFAFHTADMRAELGEIPLTYPTVRRWLEDFIAEGEEGLATQA